MKKQTERYDLCIFLNEEGTVKRAIKKVCEKNGTYPFKVAISKKGFVVSFVRNPETDKSYVYSDSLLRIVNELKVELYVNTITMRKTVGSVDMDKFPQKAKLFSEDSCEETDGTANKMLKIMEEDYDDFMSFACQQNLNSDYDSANARQADRLSLKSKRNERRFKDIIKEDEAPAKKTLSGQLAFDFDLMATKKTAKAKASVNA